MGLPPWQCMGLVGHFWAPQGTWSKRSLSAEQQTGSVSRPQAEQPYGGNSEMCCNIRHSWTSLSVTSTLLILLNPQTTVFSLKCQSNEWLEERCLSCRQNSSFLISFPWQVWHTRKTPTHHQTTSRQITGFFSKRRKRRRKKRLLHVLLL